MFDDYSDAELVEIFTLFAKDQNLIMSEGALETLRNCITSATRGKDFGNGREARQWLDASVEAQARSWVEQGGTNQIALKVLSSESIAAGFKVIPASSMPPVRRVGYL